MSRLFKALGAVLCLVFALCFAAPNAHADTFTYTYTGINFGTVVSPYTSSDSINGTVVLSAALPSDAAFADESALIVSYSFTDGVQTLTNLNSTVQHFTFTTSAGTIQQWQVGFGEGTQVIQTFASIILSETGQFAGSTVIGQPFGTSFGVGSWSGPVVATATPEPSSLALMLSGVGLVFAMRKRWTAGLQRAS
jgi:PEP-CTERM motif-containing protein